MAYKTAEPIEVEERNLRPFAIISIIFLPILLYMLYLHSINDREFVTQKELHPGYHLVDKYPFVIRVKARHSGYMDEHQFHYTVTQHGDIQIHQDHVGIVIIKEYNEVQPEVLQPGIYKLNLDLYEVQHVDMGPITFEYKGKE